MCRVRRAPGRQDDPPPSRRIGTQVRLHTGRQGIGGDDSRARHVVCARVLHGPGRSEDAVRTPGHDRGDLLGGPHPGHHRRVSLHVQVAEACRQHAAGVHRRSPGGDRIEDNPVRIPDVVHAGHREGRRQSPLQQAQMEHGGEGDVFPRHVSVPSGDERSGPDEDVHGLRRDAPQPHRFLRSVLQGGHTEEVPLARFASEQHRPRSHRVGARGRGRMRIHSPCHRGGPHQSEGDNAAHRNQRQHMLEAHRGWRV